MLESKSASITEYALEIQGPNFRRIVFLEAKDYSIGRYFSNSIILPFSDISGYHATLVRITDEYNSYSYSIFDGDFQGNRSKNGIFVNQKRCLARQLKPGDVIEFASLVKARYCVASQATLPSHIAPPQPDETKLLEGDESRYRTVISQAREGIVLVDAVSKQIVEANAAYCRLLGYTAAEILGLSLYDVVALDQIVIDEKLERSITNEDFSRELPHRRKNDSLLTVEASVSPISYSEQRTFCLVVRDITKRKHLQEQLQYQASHDSLTGLPNRNLFHEQLSIAIANAKRYHYSIAVMFLDLDGFKNINDSLGHGVGDHLLQGLAERIKSCLRAGDLLARWGGDEFTVLIPQTKGAEEVAKISNRIINILKHPFDVGEELVKIKCSIGVAFYPEAGEEAETLLQHADEALYSAKERGGNRYYFYSSTQL